MINVALSVAFQVLISDWGVTSVELCYLEEYIHNILSEIM